MTDIEFLHGDITTQQVDAIVNAANSSLLGGGGVDGAIHRAAGPSLLAECQKLRSGHYTDGLPVGAAVATPAGNLAAHWVIHTVGPRFSQDEDRGAQLSSAYTESLNLAAKLGARSVAFPAISAGAYGWPITDAARIAVQAVADAVSLPSPSAPGIELVRFVLFSEKALRAFLEANSAIHSA